MAPKEYDMIEGYLDGRLGPESARELERMAAADPDLAAELRAEEMIRETLTRDVAAMPVAATEPSPLLTAKLAATSGASGGTVASGESVLGTIFGTGTGLGVVIVVGLIGLTIGAIFFAENAELVEPDQPRIEQADPPALPSSATEGVETGTIDQGDLPIGSPTSSDKSASSPRRSHRSTESPSANDPPARAAHSDRVTDDPVRRENVKESSTDQATAPTDNGAEARDVDDQARKMVERLKAEESQGKDAIPEVDGESSSMKIGIEP